MRVGILILFSNDEKEIKINELIKLFGSKCTLEVCFVNNGSIDNTLNVLKIVHESIEKEKVSILDIKKNKGVKTAVKAGVRYLLSKREIGYIVYLSFRKLHHYTDLQQHLEDQIKEYFVNLSSQNKILSKVFSIDQILEIK